MKPLSYLLISILLLTSSLFATNSATVEENMAKTLMQLRTDVDELSTNIQDERDETKAQMRSLILEKNELDASIGRETLKIKELEREIAKVKKSIASASKNSEGIKPIVIEAEQKLEQLIIDGIPFKKEARLADAKNITAQMEQGLITPQKALVLVWNSYTDLLRMTKENGLFKQSITLDGESRLAEIARIGTVMLFFKTPDERVGYVKKENGKYSYVERIDEAGKKQILELFDALRKQIRSGYFTLPNALLSSKE